MQAAKLTRVVIADDHTVVREGLNAILNRIPGVSVVAQAESWSHAIPKVESRCPDAAILDVRMPGMEAAEGVAAIRSISPKVRIVLISAFDLEEDIYGVIQAGANGFLLKDCVPQEVELCLRTVLEGKMWLPPGPAAKLAARMHSPQLTRCQFKVLQLLAMGKTNKEVGSAMNITEGTVKIHVNQVFKKLGVDGRAAAITTALRRGLIRLSRLPELSRARGGSSEESQKG